GDQDDDLAAGRLLGDQERVREVGRALGLDALVDRELEQLDELGRRCGRWIAHASTPRSATSNISLTTSSMEPRPHAGALAVGGSRPSTRAASVCRISSSITP